MISLQRELVSNTHSTKTARDKDMCFFSLSIAVTVEPCRLEKTFSGCTIVIKGQPYYRDCYVCTRTGSENCYPSVYKLKTVTYVSDMDDSITTKTKEYVVKNCKITREAPRCITISNCTQN